MKLTRYGYDVLTWALLIALGLLITGLILSILAITIPLIVAAVLLAAFTLYFFRDPDRTLPQRATEQSMVVAPADGKVFLIRDVVDDEYMKGPATQIAIFLSPLDVHVNRIPISGTVDHVAYHKGKFAAAFKEKSDLNEQSHIGISNPTMRLLMKQIAGAVARRIVYDLKPGDTVQIGDRFGMIKFGSRTDVFVPPKMLIDVKVGDVVVGGETVLCHMPND
jgi:phosphatidylserine decarboxylase